MLLFRVHRIAYLGLSPLAGTLPAAAEAYLDKYASVPNKAVICASSTCFSCEKFIAQDSAIIAQRITFFAR